MLIEVLESGEFNPLCLVLWNDPKPVPVVLYAGDILVGVENIWGSGRWGWRYIILRPTAREKMVREEK